MKWRFLLIPILVMSLVGVCYGEEIIVELVPSSVEVEVGDTFNLSLIVKNVPKDEKCAGFETKIYYDPYILDLTNIQLSDVGKYATLKNIDPSSGYISLVWFSDPPYGSFPLATLSFKVLKPGETNITLDGVVVSDENGYGYRCVLASPVTVTAIIKPNLLITNLSMGTPLYRINTPINVTVINTGYVDANRSFSVDLYADASKIGSIIVDGLNVGKSKTLTFNWTPKDVKPYTLVVVVDPENVVPEENEEDNKIVKTVKVLPITTYVKLYKIFQNNSTIKAVIDVSNIPEERPVGGYDIYIRLENLSVTDVTSPGIYSWDLYDNTLFITGFNVSKSGKFSIVNITFTVTDTTYSMILYKVVLSDTDGYPFQKVILENEIPIGKDIKSEKIRDFLFRTKLIVGSEIDASLSTTDLNTFVLINRFLDIDEDCILIGGPVVNPVVKKYLEIFPVRVTNEYPGKHRGVIEKIKINGHTVILLAGSDRWGTKAAVEYFKTLEDLPDEPIFVEWRNGVAVRIGRP
ncbi:MAG TPA: S-layer protein [Methanothermococcus okinawensis]|nr:S-layer protein [Methanothermococcus okinawensis]